MKHSSLVYLVICIWCWAPLAQLRAVPLAQFLGGSPPAGTSPTYLVKQNFETATTGYDNEETWVTASGSPNPAYTGEILLGTQSLRATEAAAAGRVRTEFSSGIDEVHAYFLFRRDGGGQPGGARTFFTFSTAGADSQQVAVQYGTTGALTIICGTANLTTVSGTSVDQTYHVWVGYTKGTGANAFAYVAFSTDGTKPSSGNQYREVTNGSSTNQVGRIYLGLAATNAAADLIFDKVLVDDVAIGSNP